MSLSKIIKRSLLALPMLALPAAMQTIGDAAVCSWDSGDCSTTVVNVPGGWQMWIGCVGNDGSEDGGIYSGNGSWGGDCPSNCDYGSMCNN